MLRLLRKWLARSHHSAPKTDSQTDFKLLADNSNDVIIRCDLNGMTQYASPSLFRLLGIEPGEIFGKTHLSYVLPEDLPVLDAVTARHAAGHDDGLATFRMVRKDGRVIWVEGSGRTVRDPATQNTNFVIILRDISDRKALEAKLSELALTDGLTGLANRRAFDEALENEWRRTRRSGGALSLLLLDLDRFKAFNDHYGHQVGDDCLRSVASAIGKSLKRSGDRAARYGGEEIAIILPETDSAGAIAIAETVRAAIEALCISHVENKDGAGLVTISIGAATALSRVGGSVQMPAGLLQAADIALYKAKQKGRNRVETALLLTSDGTNPEANAA
jgi:diguanylate cyclase (GGDEF)-like protein/PAS domain S-box-containing protein